ncbi:MAG: DMT family transporter [Thermodesulfobacteriota bacterium]
MDWLYILIALIAGAFIPTQAGINSQLRDWTGDAALAALISFAVGTLALWVYSLVMRIPWPPLRTAIDLPWWIWTGGLGGAFFVAVTVVLVPRLGAATMVGLMIAGQVLAGIVFDHYGLNGYQVRPATLLRIAGAILLVTGVVLIRRY